VPEDVKLQFGKRLRALRRAKGLSQESLADKAGLHRSYVWGIENGRRNVSLENIVRIARALRVPPRDLLTEIK
jgi:transcriptional regulator with XRE-family HTH domain